MLIQWLHLKLRYFELGNFWEKSCIFVYMYVCMCLIWFGKMLWCIAELNLLTGKSLIKLEYLQNSYVHKKCETICARGWQVNNNTNDSECWIIPIRWWKTNNRIHVFQSYHKSKWLNPMTTTIKLDQLVCGWRQVKRRLTKNVSITKWQNALDVECATWD